MLVKALINCLEDLMLRLLPLLANSYALCIPGDVFVLAMKLKSRMPGLRSMASSDLWCAGSNSWCAGSVLPFRTSNPSPWSSWNGVLGTPTNNNEYGVDPFHSVSITRPSVLTMKPESRVSVGTMSILRLAYSSNVHRLLSTRRRYIKCIGWFSRWTTTQSSNRQQQSRRPYHEVHG